MGGTLDPTEARGVGVPLRHRRERRGEVLCLDKKKNRICEEGGRFIGEKKSGGRGRERVGVGRLLDLDLDLDLMLIDLSVGKMDGDTIVT
jgi:hypothetical protein